MNPQNAAYEVDAQSAGLQSFLTQVYTWMALGLALSGFAAVAVASSSALQGLVFGTPFVFGGLIIAELALVFAFSWSVSRGAAFPKLLTMFLAYSAVNGVTLSAILLVYTAASVGSTFFIAAGTFGGMSLYGYATRRDLASVGNFAFMGLFGLILAGLVNLFLQSSVLDFALGVIGVFVFVLLTAYDTQKLKHLYFAYSRDEEGLKRVALHGALQLYLDFINLFLYLLRLFGKRR